MSNNPEKNALIWGASGGIGRAITQALTADGWTTIAIGRDETKLPNEATHTVELLNVGDDYAVRSAVMEANYAAEHIQLWVYTVGDIAAAKTDEMDSTTWNRIMEANLTGAYLAAHHSLPLLTENAHLFFIGAIDERLRLPGLSAYAAAKAGLQAFTDAFRKEQRKKKVTLFRPGAVATPLWEKVPMKQPKDAMTPEKLATKLLETYQTQKTGTIDLTH